MFSNNPLTKNIRSLHGETRTRTSNGRYVSGLVVLCFFVFGAERLGCAKNYLLPPTRPLLKVVPSLLQQVNQFKFCKRISQWGILQKLLYLWTAGQGHSGVLTQITNLYIGIRSCSPTIVLLGAFGHLHTNQHFC